MAERKRSRLKLKAKKTNSDAGISGSKRPNKEPITVKPMTINTTSVLNLDSDKQNVDVIHIIDDDDDDISVRTRPAADIQERPKIDSKLLDLQQKLSKFRSPICDVWNLDDLPPYIEKTKRTSTKCDTCTEELLPLPRFSREYLTSKRPNYSFTVDCSEQSNYSTDIPVQKDQGNTYKRITSDDLERDSKRKKLGAHDSFNIGEFTELKKEKVIDKPATSEDQSCFPNNTKSCPICSVTFFPSVNQMEIDSHIASCLSLADDDVDW